MQVVVIDSVYFPFAVHISQWDVIRKVTDY